MFNENTNNEKVYNSKEILEYRKYILKKIINNKEILRLITLNKDVNDIDVSKLVNIKIRQMEYVNETITESDVYVCFDILSYCDTYNNSSKNQVLEENYLYFWISCSVDNYCDVDGLPRPDKIACEIENMLLESNYDDCKKIGVGKIKLKSNLAYFPTYKQRGRVMKFSVKDFYDGMRYGK